MLHLYAFGLGLLLIAIVVVVHFQALQLLSAPRGRGAAGVHAKLLTIIFGLLAAHILETAIFAFGYWAGERAFGLGSFVGARPMGTLHYFYFSLETYTTQGVGDVYATGPLRLVASLEPLVGLMLIGWSTSFTFLMMGRDWTLRARARRKG